MQWSQREKLFHAIVFFLANTKHCYKLKILKLVYAFDFEVFRQTGVSPTGLDYFAWPMGPVARTLFEDLDDPPEDMRKVLAIRKDRPDDPDGDNKLHITAKVQFDEDHFTKRELKVMKLLAEIFGSATAQQMTVASHQRGDPWHRVYNVEPQGRIPYIFALDGKALDNKVDSITQEQAEEIEQEAREAAALFE